MLPPSSHVSHDPLSLCFEIGHFQGGEPLYRLQYRGGSAIAFSTVVAVPLTVLIGQSTPLRG